MSLDTIMNLIITVNSRAPSQAGFGTPMLVGYHTAWVNELVREYAQPDEMLTDGFVALDELYLAAKIVKSQNPSPNTFKIGRRATPLRQVIKLTPTVTTEGYAYKGVIGGKTFNYVVGAGASTATVAAGIAAAINALAVGTTATVASAGKVTGSVVGPWDLEPGDTLKVAIDGDVPGAPDTATFTATAAARETTNTEATPFNLDDGMTLTVKIDGGSTQTIPFATANFVDINACTAEEVAAVINANIIGAKATATSGGTKVTITSDKRGTGSHVEVTGGTANAVGALNFATAVVDGTGNVANIDAVTAAEVKTIVELAVNAAGPTCTVGSEGGALTITSDTTGATSKVLVDATSTADDELGLDNATHTGASGGSTVTCTAGTLGANVDFDFDNKTPPAKLEVLDDTLDTTTGAELALIDGEDDDWYGLLVCDSFSKATTIQGASWLETKRKLFVAQTPDTIIMNPSEDTDVLSALKTSAYARTGAIYHRGIGVNEWLACGWLAGQLTTTPGSATPAFKVVTGCKTDKLTPAQENAILGKNGSHYTNTGGLGITFEGKTGSGDFMDTIRFLDWVYARMRERVLGCLANNPKIPFTDAGVDIMRGEIAAIIQLGMNAGGFDRAAGYTITAPLVKDVPVADRANRKLPDINWSARLAGAIHRLDPVRGLVSV